MSEIKHQYKYPDRRTVSSVGEEKNRRDCGDLVANEFAARPSGPVSLGKLRPVGLSTRNPANSLAGSSILKVR